MSWKKLCLINPLVSILKAHQADTCGSASQDGDDFILMFEITDSCLRSGADHGNVNHTHTHTHTHTPFALCDGHGPVSVSPSVQHPVRRTVLHLRETLRRIFIPHVSEIQGACNTFVHKDDRNIIRGVMLIVFSLMLVVDVVMRFCLENAGKPTGVDSLLG